MKPITLHPVSVLAGLVLAALAFLATGAAQSPIPTKTVFVGEVPAEWWTYVELNAAVPMTYTVPSGRRFVVTAYVDGNCCDPNVSADGQSVSARLQGVFALAIGNGNAMQLGNGSRVVFEPGTLLTTQRTSPVKLWGYLEPVN